MVGMGWTNRLAGYRTAGVVLFLLLLALGAGHVVVPARAPDGTRPAPPAAARAALVDGHVITRAAFQGYLALYRRLYRGPRAAPGTAAAGAVEQRIADRAIDQAIGEYLIVRAARRAGIAAPPQEVARTMGTMVAAAGGLAQARARWGENAAGVRHAATLAVLEALLARQRHDRHWLDAEAEASTIVYYVGSRAGLTPDQYPAGLPGRRAPSFLAVDLRDRLVTLDALLGRPAVLTLWRATCLGCRTDLLLLEHFARSHPAIRVVAVDEGDSRAVVRGIVRALRLTYGVWLDQQTVANDLYTPTGLPATYFLDRHGVIRDMNLGPLVDWATLEGRAAAITAAPGR